jgi:hypothetical protein
MEAQHTKPAKKSKNKANDALEKERARQIALIAMAQERTSGKEEHLEKALSDPEKQALAKAVMKYEMKGAKSTKSKEQPIIQNTTSGVSAVSMEYSVDDSTYMGDGSTTAGSTLMGQHYATDGSVTTAGTKESRGLKAASNVAATENANKVKDDYDEELSEFSIQESTSSVEVVPSDEELFGVGWAKALDAKSGSYYYFTLDRAKIVWDNPLIVHRGSTDSMDSSLPEGAAVI